MNKTEFVKLGKWGPPTATIDWCEENYVVTYYIAEFWNTISNVVMIVPPLIGAFLARKDGMEPPFIANYVALFVVGVGSWCFHATLLYENQLLDELPMIWGSTVLIIALHGVESPLNSYNKKLNVALLIYCAVVTIVYLSVKNPVFHEVAYAVLALIITGLSIKLVRKYNELIRLLLVGLVFYAAGFLIWNIDNRFCSEIREMRSQLGYPLQPILQGHAWWHVGAGMGTYMNLLYVHHTRAKYLKRSAKLKSLFLLPYVRVSDAQLSNGKHH